MSERCPKCGAAFDCYVEPASGRYSQYRCYSGFGPEMHRQSPRCRFAELTSKLAAAEARAERAEYILRELKAWHAQGADLTYDDKPLLFSAGARHVHGSAASMLALPDVFFPQPAPRQEEG